MKGRKDAYPQKVRDAVISAVLEDNRPIAHVVADVNAGTLGELGPYPVSYSVARSWVRDEEARRQRRQPLDRSATRAAAERIWAVAGSEIRKLERDSRRAKSLDPKRIRETFALVRDIDAHLTRTAPNAQGQPPVAEDDSQPQSLLERLAREDQAEPSSAAKNPPTNQASGETQPKVAPREQAEEQASESKVASRAITHGAAA